MSTYDPFLPTQPSADGRRPFSSLAGWAIACAFIATLLPFWGVLGNVVEIWSTVPEYSHGFVIPLIVAFLIWRRRADLVTLGFEGSWAGSLLVLAGFGLWFLGELSTIFIIAQYGFIVVLFGLVMALGGTKILRIIGIPLLILLFMIPLPPFYTNALSLDLQLLSSAIGVSIIRLFGISVYLEGNVIDLGTFKLQVVDACNGLRYLFPLMTLAFIVAYLFQERLWKRSIVFLASIPVAILMNSLRIGLIGVTVEYWGEKMAEGVLHDFEGWVVFMLSMLVLLGLASALHRIGHPGKRLRDALSLDFGRPLSAVGPSVAAEAASLPVPFLACIALVLIADVASAITPQRVEIRPNRKSFAEFPLQLDRWSATRIPLQAEYAEQLKTDDYLLANYRGEDGIPVNLWIAYYDSQRSGVSAHSPRSCLPGGGWEIRSLTQSSVGLPGGRTLAVNRVLIEQGAQRQLVYYWFHQRGRVITNEYLVKWYIFYDSIMRNRTDGALVRVIIPVLPSQRPEDAERELGQLTAEVVSRLDAYVPG